MHLSIELFYLHDLFSFLSWDHYCFCSHTGPPWPSLVILGNGAMCEKLFLKVRAT